MSFYIGIDGGGTTSRISVADQEKNIVSFFASGAFNINGQKREEVRRTIHEIVEELTRRGYPMSACEGIGIGTAGISNPEVVLFFERAFLEEGYTKKISLYGDHEIAMASAFSDCHGIILIAGTGSICYGITKQGRKIRCGGYGHILDDGGAGYAIGRDILTAVVRGSDGRAPKTVLTDFTLKKANCESIEELIRYVYDPQRNKKDIAAFAVLLTEAIACGDEEAVAIEKRAVDQLVELFTVVKKQMPEEQQVVFVGSVLQKNESIKEKLKERIYSIDKGLCVKELAGDASVGALRLLWKEKGI